MAAWTCPQWQSSVLQYKSGIGHRRQSARSARAFSRGETSPVSQELSGGRTPCCLEGQRVRRHVWSRPEAFSSQQQGETEYGDGYEEEEEEEEEDDKEETRIEAGGKVTTSACARSSCFDSIDDGTAAVALQH